MLSFQAQSGRGGIGFPHIFKITKLFWVIHDLLWWLKMSLSCLSDIYSIETQVSGLMNWRKSSLGSIKLVCLRIWSVYLCKREKWCQRTCGCMQGISKAERFRCTVLCVPYTHTPVWAISFTQSWWSVAERFFMPCQHAWQPPRQQGSSCCRLQWQLLLSFSAPESLSYCSQTSQDFSHTKAKF